MQKINFQKMTIFHILFLLLLIPSIVLPAFAIVDDFTTDKSLYHQGDQLKISGTVSYDSKISFVIIQIFTPGKSNFADFNTIPVNPEGSFSAAFNVGGPTWTSDGIYPIKITYDGNLEKSIKYKELSESAPPEPTDELQTNTPKNPESIFTFNTLKLNIPNFPAFDKSPQYYIDRYNDEPSYKSWFD